MKSMSNNSFNFLPVSDNISFQFTDTLNSVNTVNTFFKKKFTIHNDILINNYIIDLFSAYISHNFQHLNSKLINLCDKKDILSITNSKDYNFIYTSFNKLIKVKHTIRHYLYNKNIPKKEWIYTNEHDLSLNSFKDGQHIYQFKNYKDKTIQKFTISEINNIFKFSIFNSNDNYSFPTPNIPRNPYTNNQLSLKDMILMYNFLLKYYSTINKCLPEYIVIFKNSYFNIDILIERYKNYLSYRSTVYFIYNLDIDYKYNVLIDFIESSQFVKKHTCIKCIKYKHPDLNIFNKVLVLYELNRHGIYDYGEADILYINICKTNSLYFNKGHELSHRRLIRGRRQVQHNSTQTIHPSLVEPIITSNFEFQFPNIQPSPPLLPLNISNIPNTQQINNLMESDINETVNHFMGEVMEDVINNISRNN